MHRKSVKLLPLVKVPNDDVGIETHERGLTYDFLFNMRDSNSLLHCGSERRPKNIRERRPKNIIPEQRQTRAPRNPSCT